MALFIVVTWDVNPLHTDEIYAAQTPLGRRIIPGLLTASLLTHMGGLWAFLAQSFHLEFLVPVYVGDTLTAEAQVAVIEARGRLRLDCRISNQDGVEVLRGEIWGYPGLFERRE